MDKTEKQNRRDELWSLLGELPDRARPVTAESADSGDHPLYSIEHLVLDLNGLEKVPAYFIKPKAGKAPYPVVLYNHAHGGRYDVGRDELIRGGDALQKPPYAEALAKMGVASLAIDHWAFGARSTRTESELFKYFLWSGRVLWGMMVFDSVRTIDYLASRNDVDKKRIATLGMSMGSTMAWWLAALDTRIKVCVDICCLTDYQALIESRGLDEHGIYYYVPSLLKHFTTAQINALIAPRAHLSIAGIFDSLTQPKGLDRVDHELREVYSSEGALERWKLLRYNVGHMETAAMRVEIMDFFRRWL